MAPIGSSSEIERIIEKRLLSSVFQPIVALQQPGLLGYEALIRGPANTALHSPMVLFDSAYKHGQITRLEYACRQVSCQSFSNANTQGKLFLNVSPMCLTQKDYVHGMTHRILDDLALPADRVVIEISEQYPLDDYQLLRRATDHFRNEGFEIAIDDLGSGYSGLRTWSELRPDYVKIDRHFIEHIDQDPVKREFVRSIQEIASELNCKVIAEGIETQQELAAIRDIGIRYGQGFYIGRPLPVPAPESEIIGLVNKATQHRPLRHRSSSSANELITPCEFIAPTASLNQALKIFQRDRQLNCLPVVDDGLAQGMLERQELLELFAGEYSRSLHGRKQVQQFMNPAPLIVSHDTSLETISRQLTSRNDDLLAQNFIITRDGNYVGIGKTTALLKRITDQQLRNARYANPLTLLPGNAPIDEQLESAISQKQNIHVAYFDLDQFKPFNDYFGYNTGDQAILLLANCIKQHCEGLDFIGHVGGDDFVVIFETELWHQRCERIIDDFASQSRKFYSPQALSDGGIWGKSRANQRQFFDLMSLSVGVVNPDTEHCLSPHDIAQLAADAKKQAKAKPGNQLFISRRRKPRSAFELQAQAS